MQSLSFLITTHLHLNEMRVEWGEITKISLFEKRYPRQDFNFKIFCGYFLQI